MDIKLIASDLDGTLLQGGARSISPEMLELVKQLNRQGIRFCAASGRQFQNMRQLFAPVAHSMLFVCENGALLRTDTEVLGTIPMQRELALSIIEDILAQDGCEALISGQDVSYLCPKRADYGDYIRDFVGNYTQIITSPQDIQEDILKVSAYCWEGVGRWSGYYAQRWTGKANVAVSGERWIDLTTADKGAGLRQAAELYGLRRDEILAFGDNYNDLPMFRYAGHSCAMQGAAPEIQRNAGHVASTVESAVRTLLKRKAV